MYLSSSSDTTVYSSSFNNNGAQIGGVVYAFSSSSITADNSFFNFNEVGDVGGVMYTNSSSSITVDNSSFNNNRANNGGVMCAYTSSIINVDSSSFNNNEADNFGGVVFASSSSNINVGSSSFNNSGAILGGVMYAFFSCSITVDNSSFDNNEADTDGGVMFAELSSSITVDHCSFNNNGANTGGVMHAYIRCSITVDNSSFNNNEAENGGGVMYAERSSITVDNSSFNNNEADISGGVIAILHNSSITVDSSSFNNNEADNSGGVILALFSSGITVHASSFNNNVIGIAGGVLYAYASSSITVDNSFFYGNEASNSGGVMYALSRSSITVDNSSFNNNEASIAGGVMGAYTSSSIIVDNSSFNNNGAEIGGVMYAFSSSSITVYSSFFNNNEADLGGAVISTELSCSITLDNCSFNSSEAGNAGGVVFVLSGSSITVDNSYFNGNEVGNDGGVMFASTSSNITVNNCSFTNNEASSNGGVLYAYHSSIITADNSSFKNNKAGGNGGVLCASRSSSITIENMCNFFNNTASEGGVIFVSNSSFTDLGSMYSNNTANNNGGVITLMGGDIQVIASNFMNNTARNSGGVLLCVPLYSYKQCITFARNFFLNNKAIASGGAVALFASCSLTVTNNTFRHNSANRGGVMYLQRGVNVTIYYSTFMYNSANNDGGVIYSEYQNHLTIDSNINGASDCGGVFYSSIKTELFTISDNVCIFSGNQAHRGGVIYANESNLKVNVHSQTLLMANNTAVDIGGAVYLFKTNLTISSGSSILIGNRANHGGAIYASKSIMIVEIHSLSKLKANSALQKGGGLYLTMSNLNVEGKSSYTENRANKAGGGLHAADSYIKIRGTVQFTNNEAENGGGVSLEINTKLSGTLAQNDTVNFVSNRASQYGGALYVDDETNPNACAAVATQNATSATECFFSLVFLNFSDNSAGVSGSNLFGGLLDRCTVNTEFFQETEMEKLDVISFQRFSSINESQLDTISSHPVRLCFCRDSQPDCDYQPEYIQINRRKAFTIEFIAYDQVSNAVNATIDCSLNSSTGGLGEDQVIQHIFEVCTELHFNLFSPLNSEDLILSMRGPCTVMGISEHSVRIDIICTCPIGFQILNNDEMVCDCVCDQVLQTYERTECNATMESIIRKDNFWITYVNRTTSSGYIIVPNCPFDYCHPPEKQVSVNLNLPNGSDAQCASNRMGTLCGTCKPGLSVSLGSSHCLHCSTYWPGLLVTIVIIFILSGVGLVALLLALNLTVAVGTINAVIFYANIMTANRSALFSTSEVSFASVFISWFNFELGFETCFYDGMDTYVKTWLQLAFPAYIIILVAVIIKLSNHYTAFGHLIGRKDPVATLATLILLSYMKLLQTTITAFSSATLNYPDGLKKTVWLPDATVEYLTSKHAVLLFTTILILLVGLIYTFLLLSWQWFLHCPRKRVKWIRNHKLSLFLEVYHASYTTKHRYWTGLLLLVRVVIYLVSAFNPSDDPRITLSSTIFIMSCLFLYIAMFSVRIYKHWFINVMETFTYFNIIALSIFTWYTFDNNINRAPVTNVSVGITLAQLLIILSYHTYKYTNCNKVSRIQEVQVCKNLNEKFIPRKQLIHNHQPPSKVHPKPVEPTYSVVEISNLHPATPPSPQEVNDKIREEEEPKSQQGLNEEDNITIVEENQSALMYESKQCLNNCSEIDITEYDETIATEIKLIPKPHANPQIDVDNSMDSQQAGIEMPQSQRDHRLGSGQPEKAASHSIIHN